MTVRVTGDSVTFTCQEGCCVDSYTNYPATGGVPYADYRGPITREVIEMAIGEIQKTMAHLTIHALDLKESSRSTIQATSTEENPSAI